MAVIGKNVIENLTTGMYENINIIFREYIQNSADQIDKALKNGLLKENEGFIDIVIDKKEHKIVISDNGTGISRTEFKDKLSNIADSDKDKNEDKGFRGIGRLGGLACCNKLIFKSTYKGENILSTMIWDAKKLREVISDPNQRPSASDLVDMTTSFEERNCDKDEHSFEVQLVDILEENNELLDDKKVCEYLQAVAPVPYQNSFIFRNKIYDYKRDNNLKIDEYRISVNGEQIFKGYTADLYKGTEDKKEKYDEITELEFKDFYDSKGDLLAWMWYGISGFKTKIPIINKMRGIRLRKENIQVGDSETISFPKFFKEERGNFYFIGEVFAVHKELIPNARRDYFNPNPICGLFEGKLKSTTYSDLHKLYRVASEIKSALTKKAKYDEMQRDFEGKQTAGEFIDDEDKKNAIEELERHKESAADATKKLNSLSTNIDKDPVLNRVFKTLQSEYKIDEPIKELNDKEDSEKKYLTQNLSNLDKKERKLVSRIYGIIKAILPKDMAEMVVAKIQEELSK